MSNRDLRSQSTELRLAKLNKLADTLKGSLGSKDFYTTEHYMEEAAKVMRLYRANELYDPILTDGILPHAGDWPEAGLYNQLFSDVRSNLEIIFEEFELIEDLMLSSFNFGVTSANRLNALVKRIHSLVGDYGLYTGQEEGVLVLRDSFNSADKVDTESTLLAGEECYLGREEGVVLLPVDRDNDGAIQIDREPRIDPRSNGVPGNNYQLGADKHADKKDMIDGDPDTWFEYERVVIPSQDDGTPLYLDLLITLNDIEYINYIRLNPNNFGTRTALTVEKIETSLDGDRYVDVKEDLKNIPYVGDQEDLLFTLAPPTSKFSGQGVYTFLPRKTRFIHIVLVQDEPYSIQTALGRKLRYAIGVRDIEVRARSYRSQGQLISRAYEVPRGVSKVALRSTQIPFAASSLAVIRHFVSLDDGGTWQQIRPLDDDGAAGKTAGIPTVLSVNTGDEEAIRTALTPTSLRWKVEMQRKDAAFEEGRAVLREAKLPATEVHNTPDNAPHTIQLSFPPVEGSVHIVEPGFGACGTSRSSYEVGRGGAPGNYILPYGPEINLKRPFVKRDLGSGVWATDLAGDDDWIHVLVGSKPWTVAPTGVDAAPPDVEVYEIDWHARTLRFGDGQNGAVVPGGSEVEVYFEAERLMTPDGPGAPNFLSFPTIKDKRAVQIHHYGGEVQVTQSIPAGETRIQLRYKNITIPPAWANEVDFINGKDEFSFSADWSIDQEGGVIYFAAPSDVTTVTYSYRPIVKLSQAGWEWGTRGGIIVKRAGWYTNSATHSMDTDDIPTVGYRNAFHLPHQSIVKGGLTLFAAVTNFFNAEVPYVNGEREFRGAGVGLFSVDYARGIVFTSEELVDGHTLSASYQYTDYRVTYPLAREISPGDYEVDYAGGVLSFSSAALEEAEGINRGRAQRFQISYDYIDPSQVATAEMKDYYTPVVRDYMIRVIPEI